MANLQRHVTKNDLIRIGAYSQFEGNFRVHRGSYRFTFFTQQISDIEDLIGRVVDLSEVEANHRTYIQFYSKELYDVLQSLGFYRFSAREWNIPKILYLGDSYKKEYFRALVDSLGNIDIDRQRPYVRLQSINIPSFEKVQTWYGGNLNISRANSSKGKAYLAWHGDDAIQVCSLLDWKFNNMRNQRGAELIKNVRWDKFVGL